MGRKLETIEKFLRTRNLEGGLCYEIVPKEVTISHASVKPDKDIYITD